MRHLPWVLAALALALFAGGLTLTVVAIELDAADLALEGVFLALVLVFSGVGALVASRHPGNPIGWIFCGVAVAAGALELTGGYAELWLAEGLGPDSVGETSAWLGDHLWIPVVLPPLTLALLLYPDGRLLSRRWRPVAWAAGLAICGVFMGDALRSGPLTDHPGLDNPYGVGSSAPEVLEGVSYLLLFAAAIASIASLVLRFRGSGALQRQQIKWLAWAGAVAAVTVVGNVSADQLVGATLANTLTLLSVLCLPMATGIAILRHRLYDIDVVINRTLVYGALTATLAGAYLAIVLLLGLALSPLTEDSDLAIAGSTLAVAALFRPARRAIQRVVDRRFYRRRYDAALTLDGFGAKLRDEVDLDSLGGQLRSVVKETMQPTHVSLWVRVP